MTPLRLWSLSVETHGMRPLPDPARVAAALSKVHYRTPQHDGIEFLGLKYNSNVLSAYRVRPGAAKTVRVAVDRLNLASIMFMDPADGEFHEVPIHPAMAWKVKGRTLDQYKRARAMQRSCPDRLAGDVGLAKTYALLDDEMIALSGADGLAARRKAAGHREALMRARQPEEPPAFDVAESRKSVVDDILDGCGTEGDAPDLPMAGPGPGPEAEETEPRKRRKRRAVPSEADPVVAQPGGFDDFTPLPVSKRLDP